MSTEAALIAATRLSSGLPLRYGLLRASRSSLRKRFTDSAIALLHRLPGQIQADGRTQRECASESSAPGAGSTSGSRADASQQSRSTNATAEQVAEEMRGDVRCPARIETMPRDPEAPVDDVLGVRPGMTYEEAANVVMCTDDLMVVQPDGRGFQIQTYGATLRQGFSARLAQPRVEKTSKQIMQEMQDDAIGRGGNRVNEDMKPGESKWYVATIGLPPARNA